MSLINNYKTMKSTTSLIAFLGGAAIGAAIALLFTTEKGAEARQAVIDSFDKQVDRLSNKVDHLFHREEKEAQQKK
jgi:gas vesicle protein